MDAFLVKLREFQLRTSMHQWEDRGDWTGCPHQCPGDMKFVVLRNLTEICLLSHHRRAFQQYYREHVGVFCPTEDIFIE